MFSDRWDLLLDHWGSDESQFKNEEWDWNIARIIEKGKSLHTSGAISVVTWK